MTQRGILRNVFEIFVFIENALSCPKLFFFVINDSRNFYFLSCFVSVVSLFFLSLFLQFLSQDLAFIVSGNLFYIERIVI